VRTELRKSLQLQEAKSEIGIRGKEKEIQTLGDRLFLSSVPTVYLQAEQLPAGTGSCDESSAR
jgi:hypothetical protein